MVVYFELILAKKLHHGRIIWESRRDGFLCYRCSRSKLLEYVLENIRGGALF